MPYETLLHQADLLGVHVFDMDMPESTKGLYSDNIIWINKKITTSVEKACILAEELGHYHTSSGNILDQSSIQNRKQELKARQWAYQCKIPLDKIVQAHHARISSRYELAEYLEVSESFLQAAINRYTEKFGMSVVFDDQHIILFDPLGVVELF